MSHLKKIQSLFGITAVAITAVFVFIEPISQDLGYHQFADLRVFFGISNFFNVTSNLAFILVGSYGLMRVVRHSRNTNGCIPQTLHYIFFGGLLLTGFGSGYYHLSPNNQSLVWDRLPMTIVFMSFFSFIVYEHINRQVGLKLLWPLLAVGILSVLYWRYTENQDLGDLRGYALVQYLPILLIPLIIIMFPSVHYRKRYLWYIIGLYVMAKITENFDQEIMNLLFISGHTIKHLLAALPGIAFLLLVTSNEAK